MAINESIWGAPATWVTFSTYSAGEVKTPAATIDSYYKQWNTGGIPTNTNDVSPCFWGVGKDSIWSTPYLVAAYAAGGDLDDVQFAKRPISTSKDMPLLFTLGTTSSTEIPRYTRRYKPDAILTGLNNNFYTFPVITSFNYQKTLVIPVIRISKSDFSTTQYVTLHSYLNNPTQMTQYPYIVGIAYYMYLSEAGTRTANSYVSGLRPYMFRDIDGSIGYESKLFFARSSGISYGNVSGANNMGSTVNSIFAPENGLSAYYGITTPNATVSDPDTAIRYKYSVDNSPSDGNLVPIYYIDDNWKIGLNGNWRCVAYLDTADFTIDEIKEYVFKQIAYLGLPFVYDYQNDYNKAIGDTGIYLPVFDDNGVTTGEYVEGEDALELTNADWIDGRSSGYDPNRPPTPESGDYGYLDNKSTSNRVYSSNNRVYALTEAQYSQFIKDVNSLYLDDPDGFDNFQLDFKGTNPADYIVGTYGYTFLPAGLIPNQTPESIQLGAVTLPNAEGYRIAPTYIYNYKSLGTIDLTGAGLYKPFGDFRDFEPYTHIELYVPLCGNIVLDPAAVVGHTISIDLHFDIMTGNATACVYRDNQTLIATIAGQLAASLPLSSARMGDYQNAVKSAENALKQNELRTLTTAATVAISVGAALLAPETGGLSLAAGAAAIGAGSSLMSLNNQKSQIEYDITHKQPSISVCSAANGAVAQNISSMYAVCYVKQCKMLSTYNADEYAHTIGHACVINGTIGGQVTTSKDSLLVCSNAALSGITATAAEISAIQNLLTSGVYV